MRELVIIARIHTEFPTKFGIPRQSGLVKELRGEIVFEPEFRRAEALLGIEEFSHLWLLWEFSETRRENWSATVHPPRLGGKEKRGVFATRSPFRPNAIGLSCVKLEQVLDEAEDGPKLIVSGADLMDGTPIYDIKPYLPYADAYPDALGGFGQTHSRDGIRVVFPEELLRRLPAERRDAVLGVLGQDPRAAYNKQPDYVYGMEFAGYDIRFTVKDDVLEVCDVIVTEGRDWEKIK
ncbi:MAG: tRNA (N6-threonylcarbamoyladenosine(37)-N6)-methyltransferase TrmO [Butyrivibrio sp.]|nr:tRNA (N6-threonylcarbamoyladenosine(37)-N6)-methyltransferase TrmO [Butyrivibrio sp.]